MRSFVYNNKSLLNNSIILTFSLRKRCFEDLYNIDNFLIFKMTFLGKVLSKRDPSSCSCTKNLLLFTATSAALIAQLCISVFFQELSITCVRAFYKSTDRTARLHWKVGVGLLSIDAVDLHKIMPTMRKRMADSQRVASERQGSAVGWRIGAERMISINHGGRRERTSSSPLSTGNPSSISLISFSRAFRSRNNPQTDERNGVRNGSERVG